MLSHPQELTALHCPVVEAADVKLCGSVCARPAVLASVHVQLSLLDSHHLACTPLFLEKYAWPVVVQIKMRDLLVKVGRYPCGSLNVEVSSSGLAIADRRHVPHMPQHLSIITITPDLPDGAGPYKFAPWDTVRGFVATNVFMPEFSRLAHRSSFERRHSIRRATSTVGTVLSHRRSSSDRPASDDRPGLPMCMLVSSTTG